MSGEAIASPVNMLKYALVTITIQIVGRVMKFIVIKLMIEIIDKLTGIIAITYVDIELFLVYRAQTHN